MTHLKSEHFKVLRGAMNLLKEPCERVFHTVVSPGGDGGDLAEFKRMGAEKEE